MSKRQRRQLEARAKKISMAAKSEKKSANEVAANMRVMSDGFLFTSEWRLLRRRVVEAYGCRCMKCGHEPKNLRLVNVDHIKPRKFSPELALEFENLQVLCAMCNKQKGNGNPVDYRSQAMTI